VGIIKDTFGGDENQARPRELSQTPDAIRLRAQREEKRAAKQAAQAEPEPEPLINASGSAVAEAEVDANLAEYGMVVSDEERRKLIRLAMGAENDVYAKLAEYRDTITTEPDINAVEAAIVEASKKATPQIIARELSFDELITMLSAGCEGIQPECGMSAGAIPKLARHGVVEGLREYERLKGLDSGFIPDHGTRAPSALWEPFPVELLPEAIRDYVQQASDNLNVDPSWIAITMLSVLAAAIGGAFEIRADNDWIEPFKIWSAIVGKSGTMKSPALKKCYRFFDTIAKYEYGQHEQAKAEYERALERYEDRKKAAKQAGNSAFTEDPPAKPKNLNPIVKKYTMEALIARLADNEKGLICPLDELNGLFESLDAYRSGRGGDAEQMLELYDYQATQVDRKAEGTVRVERPMISFCGGIQPAIMAKLFKSRGGKLVSNGMMARFIFAMPPARDHNPEPPEIDRQAIIAADNLVNRLHSIKPQDQPNGEPIPVIFTVEATRKLKAVFGASICERANAVSDDDDVMAAVYGKSRGRVVRIAGILHMANQAGSAEDVLGNLCISEGTVANAIAIVEWLDNDVKRICEYFGHSDAANSGDNMIPKIKRFILGKGGKCKVRDIIQQFYRQSPGARVDPGYVLLLIALGFGDQATIVQVRDNSWEVSIAERDKN
jgi:hypothetical protein